MTKLGAALALWLAAGSAWAQGAWVQVEAQPGLGRAEAAAARYAGRLPDVVGFRLGSSNWYAVALGPYSDAEAGSLRSQLRSSGAIPFDAFVSDGATYTEQFWPQGGAAAAPVAADPAPQPPVAASPPEQPAPEPQLRQPDQSVAEARAAERALRRDERLLLQRHLKREGYYNGGLDGAFGPGTRSSMSAWQSANGYPATGVLTTGQRAELEQQYVATVAAEGPLPETPAEARAGESLLSAAEREQIQTALEWAGVYRGTIDGAFGRGTRGSMAEWQRQKGYDVTGILTTRQRARLIGDYNAILEGLQLAEIRDDTAGISLIVPTALVAFDRYEPPFAHYNAKEAGAPYRVILISQRGDRNTLHGLYDIMQTLEVVPENGPREKRDRSFTLTGRNDEFVSHTEARLVDGAVKGFTLVWPVGDEERRARVLAQMKASFTPLDGVVMEDIVASAGAAQSIDLVSGLRIRRPELSRSGFFLDAVGTVLTTADVMQDCKKITLNDDVEAEVTAIDTTAGLALLRPKRSLAPIDFARMNSDIPRLQSDVAVAGYSFEGVLGAPSLTFGTLADIRGLDGAEGIDRLDLAPQPGDVGGPVLDAQGAVIGMLLPRIDSGGRVLPDRVSFAADVGTISAFLDAQGVSAARPQPNGTRTTEELTHLAADITVLVSCWD